MERDRTDSGGPGRLSIVPTPIGNLDDITLRALESLRQADAILAEDTRRTRKLCARHGIGTPLLAFHAHSGPDAVARFVTQLEDGRHLALVSDAGTPLVSDPGAPLVQGARAAGIEVVALPGASAVTTALCVAGVPFDSFRFVGFLPRSGGKRARALDDIARAREASVVFESPHRLSATLEDLRPRLQADRQVGVCRELTKAHEEVVSGPLETVSSHFADGALGEITLVIEGFRGAAEPASVSEFDDEIRAQLATGKSVRDVADAVAFSSGLPRRQVYKRVLSLHQT